MSFFNPRRWFRRLYDAYAPLGIPVVWLQLTAERKRFIAALAGITFAVTMMMFQMGLNSALFSQVVSPLLQMRGDVVLVNPQFEYFGISRNFPQQRLYQAMQVPGVKEIASIYATSLPFKNPETGRDRDIFIMAFDPMEKPFKNPDILRQQARLKRDGVVLFDTLSRNEYGQMGQWLLDSGGEVRTEINGRSAAVEGTFQMGPTFAADGNLLMGLDSYLRTMPGARSDQISVGLLTLDAGVDPNFVVEQLRKIMPVDVKVMTMQGFIDNEKAYWSERTPIGFVIGASMAVALIVGAVIVYQILYTDVTDHLPEYATLKSIGFQDSYFTGLVLKESLILSVLGFIPGTILTAILYYLTRTLAFMPTYLTVWNICVVLLLTMGMCCLAGALATRKLRQADPAEIC